MLPHRGVRIELFNDPEVETALLSYPALGSIVADLKTKLNSRPDRALITPVLWCLTNKLRLHVTGRSGSFNLIVRNKQVFSEFWSAEFYNAWNRPSETEDDDVPQGVFDFRFGSDTVVLARIADRDAAYIYDCTRDSTGLHLAIEYLERLPELMLDAHFDSSVLAPARIDLFNVYLFDMTRDVDCRCLCASRFDLMSGSRLEQEVRTMLTHAGIRLSLFRQLAGSVHRRLENRTQAESALVFVNLTGALSLVDNFRSRLLSMWSCF